MVNRKEELKKKLEERVRIINKSFPTIIPGLLFLASSLITCAEASSPKGGEGEKQNNPVICQIFPQEGIPGVNIRACDQVDNDRCPPVGRITQENPGQVVGKTDNNWFAVQVEGIKTPDDPNDDKIGAVTSNKKYINDSKCPSLDQLPTVETNYSTPQSTSSSENNQGGEIKNIPPIPQELLSIDNPKTPINEFVNAMRMKGLDLDPIEVIKSLVLFEDTLPDGKRITTLRTSEGIALFILIDNNWVPTTPGNYWNAYEKNFGWGIKNRHYSNPEYNRYFNGRELKGVLVSTGALENGNEVKKAESLVEYANVIKTGFYAHYLFEPGKFPPHINVENIDSWLNQRITDIGELIKKNKNVRPFFIEINEPWDYKNPGQWNNEYNPMKDKYGDVWLKESIEKTIGILSQMGLKSGEDFYIVINDDTGLTNPEKLSVINQYLSSAITELRQKLNNNDLKIILGLQVKDSIIPREQIIWVANMFSNIGGIFLTEVNPRENQEEYLKMLTSLLKEPYFYGFYVWKIVPEPDSDNVDDHWILFFNEKGEKTPAYYALLYQMW